MKSKSGFTIVELIIVVVVIAILATISVVAYSGIRERSVGAHFLATVDAYQKALVIYKSENGHYPFTGTPNVSTVRTCLGNYPATDLMEKDYCISLKIPENDAGVPPSDDFISLIPSREDINAELQSILGSLPDAYESTVEVANSVRWRGITYYPEKDGKTGDIVYFLKGNQDCGRGEKASLNDIDGIPIAGGAITSCTIPLK